MLKSSQHVLFFLFKFNILSFIPKSSTIEGVYFFYCPRAPLLLSQFDNENFDASRNDAGLAAAELALAVEKHVLDSGSIDTVGTVGNSSEPGVNYFMS